MKPKSVSLSAKTRLTYRQAVALLRAATHGEQDIHGDDDDTITPRESGAMHAAIQKLKLAIDKSGGYDSNGNLLNPF